MRYFIDTEFIEGFKKPISWLPTIGNFNKPYHSIQLISIGIVAEDGREFYAISNEFNPNDASEWVSENVLKQIWRYDLCPANDRRGSIGFHVDTRNDVDFKRTFLKLLKRHGKSNKQIAKEIVDFVYNDKEIKEIYTDKERAFLSMGKKDISFYGYYADYDWVLFCSLFGTMMQLPKGFPMYCIDLKQMFDEKANSMTSMQLTKLACPSCTHDVYEHLDDPRFGLTRVNSLKDAICYPKQSNEHNALDDAKWNLELFNFLNKIK